MPYIYIYTYIRIYMNIQTAQGRRQPINGEWLKGSQSQDNCGQLRFGFIKKNLPQAKKTKNTIKNIAKFKTNIKYLALSI